MSENKTDFESNLKSLEDIVKKIESGECTLDESIALFEKGMEYSKNCKTALETAEQKISKLVDLKDGE